MRNRERVILGGEWVKKWEKNQKKEKEPNSFFSL